MVLSNFNLIFEGVYCLATKPQSTLPNDQIMQPVTLTYEHKASGCEQSHKVTPKYQLLPQTILSLFTKAILLLFHLL